MGCVSVDRVCQDYLLIISRSALLTVVVALATVASKMSFSRYSATGKCTEPGGGLMGWVDREG